ncbi:hypothetical protein H1R20_g16043, partial [Candolleomyces eurysporus]
MGVFPDLKETVIFLNNKSIDLHMDFVDTYFKEEVESGRMSSLYMKEDLEGILGGPFQCSPIAIDEKEVEGSFEKKLRLCINLSKSSKTHPSTNSFSDKEDFPALYDTAEYVANLITSSPPGTEAMVLDISKFHRCTPICASHKRWFVMQGREGDFYLQHCCPFGATASESNSAPMPRAVIRIWSLHSISPSPKWSDDVSSLRRPVSGSGMGDDPFIYKYSCEEVIVVTDVAWWVQQLSIPNFTRSLVPYGKLLDPGISVDASTDWGIGLVWGDEWDAWRLAEGWKGPWRDIGWLECLALKFLVLHLEAQGLRDCKVRVQSDNQGIIGAYYKGRSRNVEVNYSI